MKRIPLCGALLFLFLHLSAQQTTHHTVYFDFDKFDLTPQSKEALMLLAGELDGLPDYSIELQAHTDDRGTNAYNDRLALDRAGAVEDFLAGRGVLIDKISVEAYGENRPAYANDEEESRQLNRRVDLLVTSWRYDSVDDLFGRLTDSERQRFFIDAKQNARVIGDQGTSVWIPAGSFVLPDGTAPDGEIEVVLEEAYERSDMLLKGLHTTAGDRLLETGGMIYIDARYDGQALQLKDSAGLTVALPTFEQQEGMELFRGTVDAEGNLADWEAEGQSFSADLAALKMPARPPAPFMEYRHLEFRPDLSGMPVEPQAPVKPFEPHEPRRESFRYNPGFFQSIFTSKEEKNRIEETRYQKAMEDYQERLTRYEAKVNAYDADMEKYRAEMDAYREAYAAWEDNLRMQRENWEESPLYQAVRQREQEAYDARYRVYEKALERWEAKREEVLAEFETKYDVRGNLDAASVNNYFFQVNRLGWINCDRFYDVPEEEKAALAILDADEDSERVFVVFEELNSIVSTYKKDQQYLTSGLPRDARVKVIGVKVEDGRPLLAVHQLVVADAAERPLELNFEACKLSDIRKELASL